MSSRWWREEDRSHDVRWEAFTTAMAQVASAQSEVEVGAAAASACRALGATAAAVLVIGAPGERPQVLAELGAGVALSAPAPDPPLRHIDLLWAEDGSATCTAAVAAAEGGSEVLLCRATFPGGHDVEVVGQLLRVLAAVITSARSRTGRSESARRAGVLLQRHLLPHLERARIGDAAARYLPAGRDIDVGGDWYDVIETRDGRTVLVIGDVMGHSISAAVQMNEVRSALRSHLLEGLPASLAFDRVSDLTMDREAWTTCCCVELSSLGAVVTSAGHPPPIIATPHGHAEVVDVAPGPPLGVIPGVSYEGRHCEVAVGDIVVLYTDGLVEVPGADIRDGIDRLRRAVANGEVEELEQLATDLLGLVAPHDELHDDVAILAFRRTGVAPATAPGGGAGAHAPAGRLAVEDDLVWRLFDAAPDACIVVAADGTIVVANQRAEALFGHARSELIGQPEALVLPDGAGDRTARSVAGPFAVRRRDGSQLSVDVSRSPVQLGDQTYVMSSFREAHGRDVDLRPARPAPAEVR